MFVLEPKADDPEGLEEGGLYLVYSDAVRSKPVIQIDTRNLLDRTHARTFLEYQFEWFAGGEGRRAGAPLYDFLISDIKMHRFNVTDTEDTIKRNRSQQGRVPMVCSRPSALAG